MTDTRQSDTETEIGTEADAAGAGACAAAAGVPSPVWVWGLPLAPLSMAQTLDAVETLAAARRPCYFITANLYYAMLRHQYPDLDDIHRGAAFMLADGMPLVWAARRRGRPLPERVAGSDLIYALAERAAARGLRLALLGGAPGVADEAAQQLCTLYPGLSAVGLEAPGDISRNTPEQDAELVARVRAVAPDILIGAFGQPKGERWIARHLEALGVPVCTQLGASIDFVTGRVKRAPRWMQKTGLEWLFRALQEPRRLGPRYLQNIVFFTKMTVHDLFGGARRERALSEGR